MPPNTINASDLEQLPASYCIVLDEDNKPVIALSNEVEARRVIGNRLFQSKHEARQHLRIIDALAGDLNRTDRLLENELLD